MKKPFDLKKTFEKFVNNTLTKSEYDTLMGCIEKGENKEELERILDEFLRESEAADGEGTPEDLYQKIRVEMENKKVYGSQKKVRSMKKKGRAFWYGAAASAVLLAGLFYGLQEELFLPEPVAPTVKVVDPNAITLKQGDGNVSVVDENGERNIVDTEGNIIGSQKGNQLNYKVVKDGVPRELVFNELTVPYGKRFDLVLSDGTQIKLNAGTSIRYPVQFIKGNERKVYLRGEAYFDVAKDEQHPFVVNANEVNVQVLGTEFNVSFYPEDANINTVLVEGAVNLYEEKNLDAVTVLTPGNMASWNRSEKEMSVKKVDISLHTAWKDGILLFKGTPFNSIRKKLERHFDISIENQYPFLEDQVYTATFQEEGIEEILNAFKEDTPFSYEMGNGGITILNTDRSTDQKR